MSTPPDNMQSGSPPLSGKWRSHEGRLDYLKQVLGGASTLDNPPRSIQRLQKTKIYNHLFGITLRSAARYAVGKDLSPFEIELLDLLRYHADDDEIKDFGNTYAAIPKETLSSNDSIFPATVTGRDLEDPYTKDDLLQDTDTLEHEFSELPTTRVVHITKGSSESSEANEKAEGRDRLCQGHINESDGAGGPGNLTAYLSEGEQMSDRGQAITASTTPINVIVKMMCFQCHRVSNESGKDEVYFGISGGADGRLDFNHRSRTFGSVKQGNHREFGGEAIVYWGPVHGHIAATIEAWEQDNTDTKWYNDLVRNLGQIGDQLIGASLGVGSGGWTNNKYSMLVGITTRLISDLMDFFRNDDDFIAKHDLVWTKAALSGMAGRGIAGNQVTLDGGSGGKHSIYFQVDWERPLDDSYATRVYENNGWRDASFYPGAYCHQVALANAGGKVWAVMRRQDGRLLLSSRTVSVGWTYPETAQGGWIRASGRPALAVDNNGRVWCAYAGWGDKITRLAYFNTSQPTAWVAVVEKDDIQYDYTQGAYAGPGLAFFNGKLYYAFQRSTGALICFTYTPGARYMYKGPDFPAADRTADSIKLIVYRNSLHAIWRGMNDVYWHHKLNSNGTKFEVLGTLVGVFHSAPDAAVYNDRIWVVGQGTQNTVFAQSFDGTRWTGLHNVGNEECKTGPGIASYENRLYLNFTRHAS